MISEIWVKYELLDGAGRVVASGQATEAPEHFYGELETVIDAAIAELGGDEDESDS